MPFLCNAGRIAAFIPLALLAACGDRDRAEDPAPAVSTAAAAPGIGNSAETRLASAPNANLINVSGKVVSTTPNAFVLDYGRGTITVEMDDWDWYQEGRALAPGDQVVVTGRVDQDLWERRKLEASSVYAKNLNSYFYAGDADEEDVPTSTVYVAPVPAIADATGLVTRIEGQEFVLGSADGAIRVDVSQLDGGPKPQVKVGDQVYVWGDLDIDPGERSELMAKGMVRLAKDRTKTA